MSVDISKTSSLAEEIESTNRELWVDTFLWLLFITDVLNKYLDTHLNQFGVSRTGLHVLNVLVLHSGNMRPTEISKIVYRTKHTITRTIDVLERKGLVRREALANDRRGALITMTEEGLDLVKRALPNLRRVSTSALSSLNEQQTTQLNVTLKQAGKDIIRQMEQETQRAD